MSRQKTIIVKNCKLCIRCKEDKQLSEFSFSNTDNRYSSYCKPCDVKRRQNYTKNLSADQLLIQRVYDRSRSLIRYQNNKIYFILKDYKRYDTRKGFINDLTIEYITSQLDNKCVYCSYPSTGLDRINNSKGHLQENCVPCCKECNIARMDNFTHKEMFIIGKAIKQIKDNR